MSDLWSTLTPLIIGSAIVPIQIVVTILILRSPAGVRTAGAWVAGMTAVRLLQGLLFGLVLSSSDQTASESTGSALIVSTLLLVMAVLFYVTALRHLFADDDPDAPPPKWMTMPASLTPGKAFLVGAGYVAVAAKFWVFTLGAVAAIGQADLGRPESIVAFLLFVVLAESVVIVIVGAALFAPKRSAGLLDRVSDWLERHNGAIVVVLGLVFGTWFLIKALDGLGVI